MEAILIALTYRLQEACLHWENLMMRLLKPKINNKLQANHNVKISGNVGIGSDSADELLLKEKYNRHLI